MSNIIEHVHVKPGMVTVKTKHARHTIGYPGIEQCDWESLVGKEWGGTRIETTTPILETSRLYVHAGDAVLSYEWEHAPQNPGIYIGEEFVE